MSNGKNGAPAQKAIDTRAIEVATAAKERIESHEAHCIRAEDHRRHELHELRDEMNTHHHDLKDSINIVHTRIDTIIGRWLVVGGGIILLLLGIIGSLLMSGPPWLSGE